jgi:hypothetical protein
MGGYSYGHTTGTRCPRELVTQQSLARVSAPRGTLLPPEEQPAPDVVAVVPLVTALPVAPAGWASAITFPPPLAP